VTAPSARALAAANELREQCRRLLDVEGYDLARGNDAEQLEYVAELVHSAHTRAAR
jgi:hypothetical protein